MESQENSLVSPIGELQRHLYITVLENKTLDNYSYQYCSCGIKEMYEIRMMQ